MPQDGKWRATSIWLVLPLAASTVVHEQSIGSDSKFGAQMSDKNPYYSIPKALGEPREEICSLPALDPNIAELTKMLEDFRLELITGYARRGK